MNPYNDIGAQFEKLFDDNYRRLIFHALRFVDSQEEAEDIVSDVYPSEIGRLVHSVLGCELCNQKRYV